MVSQSLPAPTDDDATGGGVSQSNNSGSTTSSQEQRTASNNDSWIVEVLYSKEEPSAKHTLTNQRAVINYLERISKLNVWDYASVFLTETQVEIVHRYSKERQQLGDLFDEPSDLHQAFREERNELFQEISNVQRLIPHLFALPKEDVERASELPVIQNALHNAVRRKFMVVQVRLL